MDTNTLPSERITVLAVIDPQTASTSPGTVTSSYVNTSGNHQLMALLKVGAMSTSGSTGATVTFSLLQATSSSGAGSKALGTTATALVNVNSTNTNVNNQVIVQNRTDAMDVANGFDWVAMTAVVANSGATLDAILLGFDNRHAPGSDWNVSTVSQILSS